MAAGTTDFSTTLDFSQYFDMRQGVMTAINEVHEEMENVQAPIAEVALEHIHSQECVMIIGEFFNYDQCDDYDL